MAKQKAKPGKNSASDIEQERESNDADALEKGTAAVADQSARVEAEAEVSI